MMVMMIIMIIIRWWQGFKAIVDDNDDALNGG
jgi:hypothetical protein